MTEPVDHELEIRQEMWSRLLAAGGPYGVTAQLLRRLGIYGGAQGIWIDKDRTRIVAPSGVTVGLLHTGKSYADDLAEDCVTYHYPETGRPPGRDQAEVDATKTAARLRLPVVVVAYAAGGKRSAFRGWIDGWDDERRIFNVTSQTSHQPSGCMISRLTKWLSS